MHPWARRSERAAASDGNRDAQPVLAAHNGASSARTAHRTAAVAALSVNVVLNQH